MFRNLECDTLPGGIVLLVSNADQSAKFYSALGFAITNMGEYILAETTSIHILLYQAWLPGDVRPPSSVLGGPKFDLYLRPGQNAPLPEGRVEIIDPDGYRIAIM